MAQADDEESLSALLAALRGGAVALVGAGSSMRVGYPSWSELLERLRAEIVKRFPERKAELDHLEGMNDRMYVASRYRELLGPEAYQILIIQTFGPERAPFDDFHQALVTLPFSHILTTNYDAVLESAHLATNHQPAQRIIWSDPSSSAEFLAGSADPSYERRYVYLHGRFNDPAHIVLTEEDYNQRYLGQPASDLSDSALLATRSVIFIGFSLIDVELMRRFRHLKFHLPSNRPKHIAILPHPGPSHEEERRRLNQRYGIEPVFYPPSNDHAGLAELVHRLLRDMSLSRKSLLASPKPAIEALFRRFELDAAAATRLLARLCLRPTSCSDASVG